MSGLDGGGRGERSDGDHLLQLGVQGERELPPGGTVHVPHPEAGDPRARAGEVPSGWVARLPARIRTLLRHV